MTASNPLKRTMTVTEQIDLLRSRGMQVDSALASRWLAHVSYYRLSAYWYPARETDAHGVRADQFRPGTSFDDAVRLYEADRKLRTLVHDGMERVEVGLRTRVGEHLCAAGPLSYTQTSLFRPSFDHQDWMRTAQRRIDRATKHNAAIQHHRAKYNGQYPFWVLAEVLDFADVSRLYEGMRAQAQWEIAKELGIRIELTSLSRAQQGKVKKQHPLVRWMEQLTIVRNTCAHHARLWNKSFTPAPTAALRTQPVFDTLPEGQSERAFGSLTVMAQLLRATSPGTTWPDKIVELLRTAFLVNPLVDPASLGLPIGWDHSL